MKNSKIKIRDPLWSPAYQYLKNLLLSSYPRGGVRAGAQVWSGSLEKSDTLPAVSGDAINCACVRSKQTVLKVPAESIREDANMAAEQTGSTEMKKRVIYTFNIGDERSNGVISIETDMYYVPGWVCFAASSLLRYGERISDATTLLSDLTTFQNKHQVRLALESTFPFSFSTDPTLMDALLQDGG